MTDLKKILDVIQGRRIAVIGDLITDTYIYGDVDRISPEAPVPIVRKRETFSKMGGAGNVFQNLIGLGIDAYLYCNYDGYPIWDTSLSDKVFCNPFPNARKTRIMSGVHQLLRIDDELGPEDMPGITYKQMSWYEHLMNHFEEYEVIVLSDYGKGVLSDSVINTIIEFSHISRRPIIVDAKKDFERFKTVSTLKCNHKEFNITQPQPATIMDVQTWIVTHGEAGMIGYKKDSDQCVSIPAKRVPIVDVCGAGDTVTAALAAVYGMGRYEEMEFANLCASIVVQQPGVYPINRNDLLK